jgi:hypothetical protein
MTEVKTCYVIRFMQGSSEISCLFNFSSSVYLSMRLEKRTVSTLFQLKNSNLFSPKGQSVKAAIS